MDEGQDDSTPPVAGREGQGEFSRNARPTPKVTGTTVSSGIQGTPSGGWASLGPRPLKEQGWGKANRPKEPGKKLKSCLLNTYYVLGPGRGSAVSCPSPQERAALSVPRGDQGSCGRESLHRDSCSKCFAPKNNGLSPGRADFVFPSFSLPFTQHLRLRSRVIHWLMNSPPDVGYWNAQPST